VIDTLSSPEFKSVQDKILALSQDATMRDANGNLDVRKFSYALNSSEERLKYTNSY